MQPTLNVLLALLAVGIALSLRPWRALGPGGPPWPWLAAWAITPLLWGIDRYADVALMPPMSGAALLVLLAGWPLAIVAFVPAALVAAYASHTGLVEALHRCVWLGIVPATLVPVLGAGIRRLLPLHVFAYILGRGFAVTWVALVLAGVAATAIGPHVAVDMAGDMIGRLLLDFGEAFLTGMLAAGLVAFRPHLLATYSDRLYLPRAEPGAAAAAPPLE
jgi:uncharacterized membrane protein